MTDPNEDIPESLYQRATECKECEGKREVYSSLEGGFIECPECTGAEE